MVKRKFTSRYEACWSDADTLLLSMDTGTWRTARPVLENSQCTYCGLCALYCPPQCMLNKDDHFEPNLKYCKGCGVCARECPKHAIRMVPEGDFV